MNKYNTEDYFSVIETRTGKKILDCGEETDALAMVAFDPGNRTYMRNKFLMGQVIDVVMPKSLPTSAIDTKPYQEHRDDWIIKKINQYDWMVEKMNQLPQGQQEPFVV
jgi:hypothetical protein